jgi:peptide/nickel transport system substrate-binding protein
MILTACGSTSQSAQRQTTKAALDGSGEILLNGKRGGILTVYDHQDFTHLDPGQSYSTLDYTIVYATQRPLFSFAPNNPITVQPDLASAPPVISDGGRTLRVTIRHGVHFGPPVNREVSSADVEYAIERGANPNVATPYFRAYFGFIVGAAAASGGPISGISTPDRYTIVFHLIGPYASFLAGALSLPLSAPVPKEYAARLDAQRPTAYGSQDIVATGPYMLKADRTGRFLGLGYRPGKSAVLVRNPNWSASTDTVPAYLDGVTIKIGGDPDVIGRQVLTGHDAVENDTPSPAVVNLAYQSHYDQLVSVRGAGDHYITLNNRQGPFANADVRKALWARLDRAAMVKADGGPLVAQVATHFSYPGSASFALSGGDRGPRVDYNVSFGGSAAVAAKYMKLAGYPSGSYTGADTVNIIGSSSEPANRTAMIVNRAIESLGFKTSITLLDPSVLEGKYCGVPRAKVDVCPSASWIQDWSDPQTLLDPTFAGYNIVAKNNSNWGLVSYQDWPKATGGTYTNGPLTALDRQMRAAERTTGAAARAAAWAAVDDALVRQAVAIPWAFDKQPYIESADVRGINSLWDAGKWDYAYTSLK